MEGGTWLEMWEQAYSRQAVHALLCRVDGYKKDQMFLQVRYHRHLSSHPFVLNVPDPYLTLELSQQLCQVHSRPSRAKPLRRLLQNLVTQRPL